MSVPKQIKLQVYRAAPTSGSLIEMEINTDRISCRGVHFPEESWCGSRPFPTLWVVANEYGALGAVWATNEQEALDNLVDADWGDSLLVDADTLERESEAEKEEYTSLGNAGELADLTYVTLYQVNLSVFPAGTTGPFIELAKSQAQLCKWLAEARGADVRTLDDL